MINILIADDHELFREGVKGVLAKEKNINIVGESNNGVELLEHLLVKQPDIIFIDIKMPKMDGIEAIGKIAKLYPAIRMIAFTAHGEDYVIVDAFEAGVHGYLIKNSDKTEILEAINTVLKYNYYFSKTISFNLIKLISTSNFNPYKDKTKVYLNEVDKKIIIGICEEMTSKEIAPKINLSVSTVDTYRKNLLKKIGAKSTAGVVLYAIKKGIYKI